MSRTNRDIIKNVWCDDSGSKKNVNESLAKHIKVDSRVRPTKIKPYIKNLSSKSLYKRNEHYTHDGKLMNNTKENYKLEISNANRSLKKGVRQSAKKDIKDQLNEINSKQQ